MEPYRILLADDHSLFLHGLKRILEEKRDLKVIGEAGDGLELLDLLSKLTPHLVILDISMPNLRGIEAIHEIKKIQPRAKILMLTMHNDKAYLAQSISAGADGYFLKNDADNELLSAIEKIRRGGVYLSPSLSDELAVNFEQTLQGFRKPVLTSRETEVLKLIAEGKSNQEIGDILFISVRTVERHRANIMDKLDLKGTAEVVRYAIEHGFL